MTNELEKQFFDTFGIEPKQFIKDFPTREKAAAFGRKITGIPKYNKDKFEIGSYTNNIDIFQVHWKEYPTIIDRILLELICFIEQIDLERNGEYEYFCKFNYEDLRTEILAKSIRLAHKKAHSEINGQLFYNQVRTLFEEG